ncbi:uncharacterized protein LOC125230720 [Leguminivora glycinivorella]|uniref:uncharacterized protein LOC125230720 n=1 Tax=Leguminivora glycinivorella TaxID=1035111 RepID=UPI00200ED8F6|nr:uncharacterized protein LOC125230720 [Leguminivora glycinivorella]
MGKRKEELRDDEIRRKIQKLENKLAKKPARRRIISSSSDSSALSDDDTSQVAVHKETTVAMVHCSPDSPRVTSPRAVSPLPPPPPPPRSPQDMPSPSEQPTPPEQTTPPQIDTETDLPAQEEQQLDDEILSLLGDAPKSDQQFGPPVHKDIANRWQEILVKGLDKETKEKLLKQYMIPRNCDMLLAPKLNPEAKAALSDGSVKRDFCIMQKQNQVGVALAALASVTEAIISGENNKQKLLKPLSDACRILCDNHHSDTMTRRHFVLASTDASLKETLVEAERDTFLFGENVSEKLKVAKSIQKTGESLKQQQKSVFNKNNFIANKGHLNFKPHRRTDNKPGANTARTARAPRTPQRYQPSASSHPYHRRAPPPHRARTPSPRRTPRYRTYRR